MTDCVTVSSWDEAVPYLLKGYVLTTIARTYSHGRETGCSMSFAKMDMEEIVRIRQLNTALQAQVAELTKYNEAFAEEWDKCKADLGFEDVDQIRRFAEQKKALNALIIKYDMPVQASYSTVQEELGNLQTKLVGMNMQLSQVVVERDILKKELAECSKVKGQVPMQSSPLSAQGKAYTSYRAHRRTCPDWTEADANWCAAQWHNPNGDKNWQPPSTPRPSPGTDKCNCGVRRNARASSVYRCEACHKWFNEREMVRQSTGDWTFWYCQVCIPPQYCYISVKGLDHALYFIPAGTKLVNVGVSKAFCDMWLQIGVQMIANAVVARKLLNSIGSGKPSLYITAKDVYEVYPELCRHCPQCGQVELDVGQWMTDWCSYCVNRGWTFQFADAWRDIAIAYWWQQFAKVWEDIGKAMFGLCDRCNFPIYGYLVRSAPHGRFQHYMCHNRNG